MSIIDTISLSGITARGFHGVFEHERVQGQNFVVDVRLGVDELCSSDQLDDTVDYAGVTELVVQTIQSGPYQLIETLAHAIADRIMAEESLVKSVRVTVHKPQAPLDHVFTDVAVTLLRSR